MNVHETTRSEAVEQASDRLGRGSSEAADVPSSSSAGEQVRRGPSSPGSPSLLSLPFNPAEARLSRIHERSVAAPSRFSHSVSPRCLVAEPSRHTS